MSTLLQNERQNYVNILMNIPGAIRTLNFRLMQIFQKQSSILQPIGAWPPNQIVDFFDNFDNACECLIIQDELWRHESVNEVIVNHSKLEGKQIYIAKLGYQNKRINNRLSYLSYPWLFMWGHMFNRPNTFDLKPIGLEFGFNCLNNRPAPHRLLLGSKLLEAGLLKDILYTQNIWGEIDKDLHITPQLFCFINQLPIRLYEESMPLGSSGNIGPVVDHISHQNSYCTIITETETDHGLEIITEKSYKPFIAKQIPLYLSCPGHLLYLKSLGFEVFENLYPAGYDFMTTDQKIQNIVDIVALGKDYIEDFYFAHTKEIQHNHDWYFSGNVQQLIFQRIQEYCLESLA